MAGCSDYTPETCPCNVHSARRAEARRATPPQVQPLEDLAKPEPQAVWEAVIGSADNGSFRISTERLRVPGGWLYKHTEEFFRVPTSSTMGLVFVPDPS